MSDSKSFLLDTDIIIDHLRGYKKSLPFFEKIKSAGVTPYISTITIVELYSFSKMEIPFETEKVEMLIKYMSVLSLDRQIAKTTGEFRRKYSCSFPDAAIAATAYLFKLELKTRNIKHYKIIEEISAGKPY